MNSNEVKQIVLRLGLDLCGIASVDRFHRAPKGFHPTDIYEECKSVIVFAKKMPAESAYATSCIPYTHICNLMIQEVDAITLRIAGILEKHEIRTVVIPADDPYEYWENENQYGRAILSLRHAGYLAGLGILGKNTLLLNRRYGNMIQLGAVLTNIALEPDEIANYQICDKNCHLCIDNCPQKALDGKTVSQKLCRPLSNYRNEKGYVLKKCNICRRICPNSNGMNENPA